MLTGLRPGSVRTPCSVAVVIAAGAAAGRRWHIHRLYHLVNTIPDYAKRSGYSTDTRAECATDEPTHGASRLLAFICTLRSSPDGSANGILLGLRSRWKREENERCCRPRQVRNGCN